MPYYRIGGTMERDGLPYTRPGRRRKFYDLAAVKHWLNARRPAPATGVDPAVAEAMERLSAHTLENGAPRC